MRLALCQLPAGLLCSFPKDDDFDGLEDDLEVEDRRDVFQVVKLVLQFFDRTFLAVSVK